MKKIILILLIIPIIGFSQEDENEKYWAKEYKGKKFYKKYRRSWIVNIKIPAYPKSRKHQRMKGVHPDKGYDLVDGMQRQYSNNGGLCHCIYVIHGTPINYDTAKNNCREMSTIMTGQGKISDYDLEAMTILFLKDLYNSIIITDGSKINRDYINRVNIDVTFESLEGDAIAISYGMNDDKNIIIKADPVKWKNASKLKRWFTIYHELGHDVLNFRHGQGGKLMFNYTFNKYSWEEFDEDKQYMFERYIDKLNKNQAILN